MREKPRVIWLAAFFHLLLMAERALHLGWAFRSRERLLYLGMAAYAGAMKRLLII